MKRYPDCHQLNQFLVKENTTENNNQYPIWTTELLMNQSHLKLDSTRFDDQFGFFATHPNNPNQLTLSPNLNHPPLTESLAISPPETALTPVDREIDQQIAALVVASRHNTITIKSQANITTLQQKAKFSHKQLQNLLEIIHFLITTGTLKALKTIAFIIFGTIIVTWLFHQETAPIAQESEPKPSPKQPHQPLTPQPEKKRLTVEPVAILPPQPIEKSPQFSRPVQPPQKTEKPPVTSASQTNSLIVDRYYIPQTTASQRIIVERYYIPTTTATPIPTAPSQNQESEVGSRKSGVESSNIQTVAIPITATPVVAETTPNPEINPVQGTINPEQPISPISRAAIAVVQPTTAETPSPPSGQLQPTTNQKTYLLTGIMGFEENSVALFQSGEETLRVYLGEQLNFGDWKLVDIIDGKAILQKGNKIITLRAGESLANNDH
jgi:hypothetical protein